VPAPHRFRALSLDLWFTTLFYEAGDEERWSAARVQVLRDLLRSPDEGPFSASQISAALRATRPEVTAFARSPDWFEPLQVVQGVAQRLGGQLRADPREVARRYSAAGLEESPPRLNPEVRKVAAGLPGVPLLLISNTGRLGSTWAATIESLGGPRFSAIVTSCEVGWGKPDRAIFDEASRRIGVPGAEILHVGDRWDLDVEGALGAGFGAALYTGLWDRYPLGTEADPRGGFGGRDPADRHPGVLYLDHLEELLEGDRFLRGGG